MAKTIEVTATQVNAARLLVKQAAARGESVPPAVVAMANATPLTVARNGRSAHDRPDTSSSNGRANGQAAAAPAANAAAKPVRPRFAG